MYFSKSSIYNDLINTEHKMKKYQVICFKTKKIMGTYSSRKRARNKADKLDMIYGCYNYRIIEVDMKNDQSKDC